MSNSRSLFAIHVENACLQTNTFVAAQSDIDVNSDDDGRVTVELTEAGIQQRRQNAVHLFPCPFFLMARW